MSPMFAEAAVAMLSAVQLHGSEPGAYVNALREALPRNVPNLEGAER